MMPCMKIFLAKMLLKLRMWRTTDSYADYYDDSPATHDNPDYVWARFFTDDENDSNFEGF